MAGYFGVPRKVKKELADECGGKKSASYKATLAFYREIDPPRFSRHNIFGMVPYLSRALSLLDGVGSIFEPPEPFAKMTRDVNLSAVFSHSVMPSHTQAQTCFDRLQLDEKDCKLDISTYKQLHHVANDRVLDDGALRKSFVVSNEVRTSGGRAININPYSTRKIGIQRISGGTDRFVGKLENLLQEFGPAEQKALLNRCDFSKTKLTRDDFTKLEKIADKRGLDLFENLKVSPDKIQGEKVDTAKMIKMIVEAVRNKEPLDLKCRDIRKADLQEAFKQAAGSLAKEGKSIQNLKLDGRAMAGVKLKDTQQFDLNNMLEYHHPGQAKLSEKTASIKTPLTKKAINAGEAVVAAGSSVIENVRNQTNELLNYIGTKKQQIADKFGQPQTTPQLATPQQSSFVNKLSQQAINNKNAALAI